MQLGRLLRTYGFTDYNVHWSDHYPKSVKSNFSIFKSKNVILEVPKSKVTWGERKCEQIGM